MPIFEYECLVCGHRFESIRKMSEYAPDCPECQSSFIQKAVSTPNFAFKGGGWSRDGYGGSQEGSQT